MFCPNCGTKNDDNALFCASCGIKLQDMAVPPAAEENVQPEVPVQEQYVQPEVPVQEQYVQPDMAGYQMPVQPDQTMQNQQYYGSVQKAPKKPFKINKLVVATVLMLFVFVGSIVVFVNIGKSTYSAKTVATDYFEAYTNRDWNTLYDMIDVSDSTFINKESFNKVMSTKSTDEINKYTVRASENRISAEAVIKYRERGESENQTMDLSMNKQSQKQFLLFDTWRVSSSNFIAKDFMVTIPSGTTLYIDDIEVPDSYIYKTDDNVIIYKIDKIFLGTHVFYIDTDDFTSSKCTYNVSYDDDEYNVDSITLDKDMQESLIQTAYSHMTQIVEAAVSGQKFDAIEKNFDESCVDEARDQYESYFAASFYAYAKDKGITSVSLSNVKGSVTSIYVKNGSVYVSVEMEYSDTNKGYSKDWWTGTLKEGTADTESYTTVVLKYVDSEWLVGDEYSIPTGIAYNNWF